MSDILTPDICVIGAGSGGLTVAAAAAQFGVDVVLIERGKMGGDCLNYGCVPSKALIAAAKRSAIAAKSGSFGISFGPPDIDFRRVHDHVHEVIAEIAPMDSVERFEGLGVTVLQSEARFVDRETVEAGGTMVKARRFVLATGSVPAIPPVEGLSDVPYLTNETLFDIVERPDSLIVLGGGPIGVEMAQAFARLGSRVTLVEMAGILAKDDPEAADIVRGALADDGVTVLEKTQAKRVSQSGGGIAVEVSGTGPPATLEATALLVATGRKPQLDGLDLDTAGIAHAPEGIVVNKSLKTSNPKVFAIGDCIGGPQFTHVAGYQAGLVVGQILFRAPLRENRSIIPWVTYTSPELAHVGLTEAEAREDPKHRRHVKVLKWQVEENDRAKAERTTSGFIKVLVGRRGRILGADIVAENAGELIASWSLAVSAGLRISAFRNMIAPYPTVGEIGKRAALTYYAGSLTSPLVRKIIAVLRRFG